MSTPEIRSEKIQNMDDIDIAATENTKASIIQYAGFTKGDKFCFYSYDENRSHGALLYLSRFQVRTLINTGGF